MDFVFITNPVTTWVPYLDCMTHSEDMCFQCGYYKLCSGVKRTDCETVERATMKKMIDKETKIVRGTV